MSGEPTKRYMSIFVIKNKRIVRIALAFIVISSSAVLLSGLTSSKSKDIGDSRFSSEYSKKDDLRTPVAPPSDGITVATTAPGSEERGQGYLVAIDETGRVLYYEDKYQNYFDIDPVEGSSSTVEFIAVLPRGELPGSRKCPKSVADSLCEYNTIIRLNISSGDSERVYETVTTRWWHDVDRIDSHRFVVADIANNRVIILNTSTGIVEWSWNADQAYSITSGGTYPQDWTHLNDVEYLSDGRIMVSLRNQDSVVFLTLDGINETWSLGQDDDHQILYEQHNPDYVPPKRGGPAILVADSENSRIVEYQRNRENWKQSWSYTDTKLSWPRDADRLPNGNTLIAGVHDHRIIEVSPSGQVVWSVTDVRQELYDVERLRTGDESSGGMAASSLNYSTVNKETNSSVNKPQKPKQNSLVVTPIDIVIDHVPSPVISGLRFLLPEWMGFSHLISLILAINTVITWVALEVYWSGYRIYLTKQPTFRTQS